MAKERIYARADGTRDITGDQNFTSTGAVKVPAGTSAQRPTPQTGHIRHDTSTGTLQGYDSSKWKDLDFTEYKIVHVSATGAGTQSGVDAGNAKSASTVFGVGGELEDSINTRYVLGVDDFSSFAIHSTRGNTCLIEVSSNVTFASINITNGSTINFDTQVGPFFTNVSSGITVSHDSALVCTGNVILSVSSTVSVLSGSTLYVNKSMACEELTIDDGSSGVVGDDAISILSLRNLNLTYDSTLRVTGFSQTTSSIGTAELALPNISQGSNLSVGDQGYDSCGLQVTHNSVVSIFGGASFREKNVGTLAGGVYLNTGSRLYVGGDCFTYSMFLNDASQMRVDGDLTYKVSSTGELFPDECIRLYRASSLYVADQLSNDSTEGTPTEIALEVAHMSMCNLGQITLDKFAGKNVRVSDGSLLTIGNALRSAGLNTAVASDIFCGLDMLNGSNVVANAGSENFDAATNTGTASLHVATDPSTIAGQIVSIRFDSKVTGDGSLILDANSGADNVSINDHSGVEMLFDVVTLGATTKIAGHCMVVSTGGICRAMGPVDVNGFAYFGRSTSDIVDNTGASLVNNFAYYYHAGGRTHVV